MALDKFPVTKIPQNQLASLVQQFDVRMQHASKTTRHVYRKALDQLLAFTKSSTFKFMPKDFGEFRLWLFNDRKLSKNTVNVYLTASRRFCEFLIELGILKKNPAWSVHGSAQEFKSLKVKLTEVAAAISSIDTTTVLGKRDFAFLSTILESGAKISELINADIGDLKRYGRQAKLRVKGEGARGEFELVSISPSVSSAIFNYLESRSPVTTGEPLFSAVRAGRASNVRLSFRGARAAMHRHLNFGGERKVRLDSLRTYCAIRLMSRGKSSDEVRSIMRFKSDMPFRKIMHNTKSIAGTKA
jgi:site-specific recombinase XerC